VITRPLAPHEQGLARQRGDRRVLVETNRDWDNARGLYQRAGFTPYAEDEVSVYLSIDLS